LSTSNKDYDDDDDDNDEFYCSCADCLSLCITETVPVSRLHLVI